MKPLTLAAWLLLGAGSLYAQSGNMPAPSSPLAFRKSYFAYYGRGFGGEKSAGTLGAFVQVSQRSVLELALHGTYGDRDYESTIFVDYSEVKQVTSQSLAVLYGRVGKRRWGQFSVLAGPAIVGITRYDVWNDVMQHYDGRDLSAVGLMLKANLMPAWRFVGFGASPFLNLNGEFVHGGITFNLALGSVHFPRDAE